MNAPTGAEALVRLLDLYEVRHVFGLCGDTSLPFYDALHRLDHRVQHVLTRDERSAAYMADAYARVTGRVGVCEGPSGGGATYLLPGLVEANESCVPVLGITSDVAVTARGRYPLTELDQVGLYRPATKWNERIERAAQLPGLVRAAFRAMTTGRPGAAHLALPYDVQREPVDADDLWAQPEHGAAPAWRSAPDPRAVERAAEALLAARRPVIVAGGGVVGAAATDELAALARLLDAPICTTVTGQGAVAETDPYAAGVIGSNGGIPATRAVVDAADLVLFVACRAGSTTTEHWRFPGRGATILHLDCDPAVIAANYRTTVALVGDAKLGLAALAAALGDKRPNAGEGRAAAAAAQAGKAAQFAALSRSDERPIRPERLVAALQAALPDDAIVVADPGTPCPYLSGYYTWRRAGRHFLTNRAHGALGYALPASLGAWYGRPSSKICAVMGDGSFGFAVGEMETLVRCRAPILMVVVSNAVYGWIKASQRASYGGRYYSVDFSATDHARIAEAYGVRGYRVEDPAELEATLRRAAEHDGPALVDVVCQPLQEAAAPVSQWMG